MKTTQTAEDTYINTRSLIEFNLELKKSTCIVPENMVLVLPVRFQNKTTGNSINTERFLPVNNFFGHFIKSVNIYKEHDLIRIVPPLPSGSVGWYMSTILQHMTEEQLKVLERNILYIKTPVVGTNIENRINRLGDTDNYDHFQHRRWIPRRWILSYLCKGCKHWQSYMEK